MRTLLLASALLTLVAAAGCGWNLRGWNNPSSISSLNLISPDRYAPLTLALLETMQQQGITDEREAPLQLILKEETLHKRTVAVTSIGSPSQYELSLSTDYQYRGAGGQVKTVPRTLTVFRDFDFDPNNTVAKNEEENTLLEEMRRELALRILQRAPAPVEYDQTQL